MSKFYGTVWEGGSGKTSATRRGFQNIKAAAQTWNGSVIVTAKENQDGETIFCIEINKDDSAIYGRNVFEGTLDELIKVFGAEDAFIPIF